MRLGSGIRRRSPSAGYDRASVTEESRDEEENKGTHRFGPPSVLKFEREVAHASCVREFELTRASLL